MDKAEKKAEKARKKAEKAEKAAVKKADQAEKKTAKMKKQAEAKAARAEKNAQRRIAKQEKKAEKLAKKVDRALDREDGEGQKDGKKKGGKKKLLLLVPVVAAAAAAAYLFVIPKLFPREAEEPGEPEPIDAPVVYKLGATEIPALPALGEVLVYLEEQTSGGETAGPETLSSGAGEGDGEEEGEPEPEVITAVTYRYEGFSAPIALMASYAELMTTEDAGFSFVTEDLVRMTDEELPDMTGVSGLALLARNSLAEEDAGKALTIQLKWTPAACFVTLDTPEGSVRNPPPPPTPAVSGTGMTAVEAMDYFRSIDPARLGLSGESMDSYNVYAMDGVVMVNGLPCMHIRVYQQGGQTDTNEIAGSYFVTSDGQHIYRLDAETSTVVELDSIG